MRTDGSEHGEGFVIGLATGALVGAGLAFLLSPKSGSALRDDLDQSVTTLRGAVADRYRDLAAKAGVQLDNLQERVDRVAESVESGARELIQAASRQTSRHG